MMSTSRIVVACVVRGFVLSGVAACGLSLGGCTANVSDAEIRPIGLTEVRTLTESPRRNAVLLVDPRAPTAFAQGHIPGARNMLLTEVSGRRDDIDPRVAAFDNIVVYGEDPGSATATAMTKRLMQTGYRNVRMFTGGLREWRRAGLPIQTERAAEEGTPAGQ